jgi:hypothetical protein
MSDVARVNLTQQCIEGGTIHFFIGLLNDVEELTWDDLKKALLECYGLWRSRRRQHL